MAWALVRVVIMPAPRGKGVATYFSPTRPRERRKNSSIPSLEGTLRVSLASTVSGRGWFLPASQKARGLTICSKHTTELTGYPGAPTRILLLRDTPSRVGLPGMALIPCTRTRPCSSMVCLV